MNLLLKTGHENLSDYLDAGLGTKNFEVNDMKRFIAFPLVAFSLVAMAACTDDAGTEQPTGMEAPPVNTAPAPVE